MNLPDMRCGSAEVRCWKCGDHMITHPNQPKMRALIGWFCDSCKCSFYQLRKGDLVSR